MLTSITAMKGLGITAVFATIGVFWNHLKNWILKFRSIFFVEVEITSDTLAYALYGYLNRNLKRGQLSVNTYSVFWSYLKPIKRRCYVIEEIPQGYSTYWKRWRPLVFSFDGSSKGDPSCKISFFRGFYDLKKIMYDAITETNNLEVAKDKDEDNRFYVEYFYGSFGERPESDVKAMSEEVSNSKIYNKKLIHWKHCDLGLEEKKEPLSNLYYPQYVLDFIDDVDKWYKSKRYLQERDLPWHMGAGLFGLPGTGKSSLVKAIAQKYNMPVFIFDLTSMSNEELRRYWGRSLRSTPCIILFEDIDRLFDDNKQLIKRTNNVKSMFTLDTLLNCIQGVDNSDGVLTILTANFPERLDPALTRKGRVNCIIELREMDLESRTKMAKKMLGDHPEIIKKVIRDGDGMVASKYQHLCTKLALDLFWKEKPLN